MVTIMMFLSLSMVPLLQVSGHGNMVYPPVWMDRGDPIGCGVLDLPHTQEEDENNGKKPDCLYFWYSNDVRIPGEPTIPEDVSQDWFECFIDHPRRSHNPWNAPGTAPIFSPCGSMGGNPLGCNRNSTGQQFGDCCSGNCDGFSLGKGAEEYEWPEAPVTEWLAGTTQQVAWQVGPNHGGGYSYRMCKTPKGGIKDLTEECFQETPLDFVGEEQWVVYGNHGALGTWDTDKMIQVEAKRTTKGTFPPGSMWTMSPITPPYEEGAGGSPQTGHGHIIDMVQVPENLEPGEYVLSFRWDCKCSSQSWGVCSNILIV